MSANEHKPDDAAIEQAVHKVAEALECGRPRSSVALDLVAEGWGEAEAMTFVTDVDSQLKEQPAASSGSGAMGWIVWIGILGLINFLSWAFDWPFWLY
ncbi:MAG: hypothetical protein QF363_01755 [Planctomycetaceae bacterium]|jgi:hypothetical protein|nr:hypothetical protein [Planctomycetaceae bacterium]